jgi:peptidoglycan L-alanyl-D-glutamate endopeptidase CwlK
MLTIRDNQRLEGVNPELCRVVRLADESGAMRFTVLEGLRTIERQRQLLKSGASTTLRSRHLTGHAVDLAPMDGSGISWAWPLYDRLAIIIKAAAHEAEVPIEWGGDWTSFRDGPHWQLPWVQYP